MIDGLMSLCGELVLFLVLLCAGRLLFGVVVFLLGGFFFLFFLFDTIPIGVWEFGRNSLERTYSHS